MSASCRSREDRLRGVNVNEKSRGWSIGGNGDRLSNGSEVEELEIELVDVDRQEFKLEYELSEDEFELEIEDEIGILDAETIVELSF